MKRPGRIYRSEEEADDATDRSLHRLAVGLGLLLAAALVVLTLLVLFETAG